MKNNTIIEQLNEEGDEPMEVSEEINFQRQALRYNQGKLKWALVDFKSLEGLVEVLEYGANKYAPDNWKKGMPVKEVAESLMRHLFAFLDGEDVDPESGCRHISHVMCNAMFIEFILREKAHYDNRKIETGDK